MIAALPASRTPLRGERNVLPEFVPILAHGATTLRFVEIGQRSIAGSPLPISVETYPLSSVENFV